jgi:hypothetical protein
VTKAVRHATSFRCCGLPRTSLGSNWRRPPQLELARSAPSWVVWVFGFRDCCVFDLWPLFCLYPPTRDRPIGRRQAVAICRCGFDHNTHRMRASTQSSQKPSSSGFGASAGALQSSRLRLGRALAEDRHPRSYTSLALADSIQSGLSHLHIVSGAPSPEVAVNARRWGREMRSQAPPPSMDPTPRTSGRHRRWEPAARDLSPRRGRPHFPSRPCAERRHRHPTGSSHH